MWFRCVIGDNVRVLRGHVLDGRTTNKAWISVSRRASCRRGDGWTEDITVFRCRRPALTVTAGK